MRYLIFKSINLLVAWIPTPILNRLLRSLYLQPKIADRTGYTIYPQVFYNPFPIQSEVDLEKLKQKRDLPGVKFNLPLADELLQKQARYAGEINEFIKNRKGNIQAWNITYPVTDSAICYSMLRDIKPKRYIEVGCGFSSNCSAAALHQNASEGHPCKATYIDPYPSPHLSNVNLPGEFVKERVENIPLSVFKELEAGDVLFIDTSHVIKVQNDVEYVLIHVLTSLKPGVIVHVHDIFSPYDYPADWLVGEGSNRGGNNEQYALECFLSGGDAWEVTMPLHLLWRDKNPLLKKIVDDDHRPAAIWIQRTPTRSEPLTNAPMQ